MKEIDFIPEWYKANQNRKKSYHRQYVMLACLFVLLMVWSFVVGEYIDQLRAEVEDIQLVFEKGKEKVNQALSLEAEIALLQQQSQLLETTAPRTDISPILAELSWLIRDNIVLSRLSLKNEPFEYTNSKASTAPGVVHVGSAPQDKNAVSAQATRIKITLTGIAARAADAAELISHLEDSDYFEQVSPVYTKAAKVKGRDITEFEIRMFVADYNVQK
jgi:hypothetical protein